MGSGCSEISCLVVEPAEECVRTRRSGKSEETVGGDELEARQDTGASGESRIFEETQMA